MKYPAIYKSVEGSEYLYQNKDSYYCYGRQLWDSSEPHHDCHHSDTNITTEYLANTYGEVKSKEHAEFIVKLAEVNGFTIDFFSNFEAKSFIIKNECLSIFNVHINGLDKENLNKITIPLPPERESVDEWPKVGSSVEWGHTGKGEVKSLSDGFAWIKLDNKDYTTVYVSSLRKPKTPEQELRDFLHLLWRENNEDFDDFADIAILHLKKKGEGDE